MNYETKIKDLFIKHKTLKIGDIKKMLYNNLNYYQILKILQNLLSDNYIYFDKETKLYHLKNKR